VSVAASGCAVTEDARCSAVLGVLTATSFFFALSLLPLADAIALSFISPAITALMGAMILGERLDWRIAVALAAGFLGMLLIVGGKDGKKLAGAARASFMKKCEAGA
jgi:S-adenosylmethionine uptake transporter